MGVVVDKFESALSALMEKYGFDCAVIADRDGTRAVAQAYALECRRRYSRERMGRELCDVLGLERTPG